MPRFPVTALRSVELGTPDLDGFREILSRRLGPCARRARAPASSICAQPAAIITSSRSTKASSRTRRGDLSRREPGRSCCPSPPARLPKAPQLLRGPAPNEAPDGGVAMTVRAPEGGVLRFVHGDIRHAPEPQQRRPARAARPRQSQQHRCRSLRRVLREGARLSPHRPFEGDGVRPLQQRPPCGRDRRRRGQRPQPRRLPDAEPGGGDARLGADDRCRLSDRLGRRPPRPRRQRVRLFHRSGRHRDRIHRRGAAGRRQLCRARAGSLGLAARPHRSMGHRAAKGRARQGGAIVGSLRRA